MRNWRRIREHIAGSDLDRLEIGNVLLGLMFPLLMVLLTALLSMGIAR